MRRRRKLLSASQPTTKTLTSSSSSDDDIDDDAKKPPKPKQKKKKRAKKVFKAFKTMRVPVVERRGARVETWLRDPDESLSVVFDENERLTETRWRVKVMSKKKITIWALNPSFTLEIMPPKSEEEMRMGKQAFRGFDLELCNDEDAVECE